MLPWAWYRQASGLRDAIALDARTIRWDGDNPQPQQELQGLRQEVERWKQETTALRQQLEQRQQQLERTRQELERGQRSTDTERQLLEQTRLELEQRKQQAAAVARDDAEFKRLEAQLQQREAELARQLQAVTRLQQEKTQLEAETARQRARLTEVEQQQQQQQQMALAGPTIEIVDPPAVGGTRGLQMVKVSAGIVGQQRDIVGKVTSPAGVLTFTVNDRAEKLDERGLFRVPVTVRGPSVPVKVVAVDRQGNSTEAREHWLKTITEKRSRTVLSSGALQPVLDSGGGDHSVFAKALLDVLASNTEVLEGQRVGLELAARVSYAASNVLVEQDPQYAPLRYAGHEAGDFLFVPTVLQ